MIEPQSAGGDIRPTLIQHRGVRRGEVLAALVSDVGFRRSQVAPVSGGFEAAAIDRHDPVADIGDTGLRQHALNGLLRLCVLTLAELLLANATTRIEEIQRWPGPDS